MFKLELGAEVTDSITDFEGTIVARCEYLNGCIQYQLEGDEPTKPGGEVWIDEQRLSVDKEEEEPDNQSYGGGSRSHPSMRH